MLPLVRTAVVFLIGFASAGVAAAELAPLQAGRYVRQSGSEELCPNFTLTKDDLTKERVALGLYYFRTATASMKTKSDLDPKCNFLSKTERRDEGSKKIILKNTREETCDGKLRKHAVTTATLTPGKIVIHQEADNAQSYECRWAKK